MKSTAMEINQIQSFIVQQNSLLNQLKQGNLMGAAGLITLGALQGTGLKDIQEAQALLSATTQVSNALGIKTSQVLQDAQTAARLGISQAQLIQNMQAAATQGATAAKARIVQTDKANADLQASIQRRTDIAAQLSSTSELNAITQLNGQALLEISKQLNDAARVRNLAEADAQKKLVDEAVATNAGKAALANDLQRQQVGQTQMDAWIAAHPPKNF
jgi:hypothetical protein